jgi:nitrous oxidase accessory protein
MKRTLFVLLILATLTISGTINIHSTKANSSTITVPDNYPTIASAINNAASGDTILVKTGTYQEQSLIIDKSITLKGQNANNTTINDTDPPLLSNDFPPVFSAAIRIEAQNVKITGLTLTGGANGITGKGDGTQIVDNIINAEAGCINLNGSNQTIAQNKIQTLILTTGTNGFGIHIKGSYNNITTNNISGSGNYAITLEGSFNTVYGNTIAEAGTYVNGYGNLIAENNLTGISIEQGSFNTVHTNIAKGGLSIDTGYNNTFYANSAEGISIGVRNANAANNTFYHNNFRVEVQNLRTWYGAPGPNFWDNGKEGNYWTGYEGTDTNKDGIGDLPYIVNGTYYNPNTNTEQSVVFGEDNYPLMFPFNINDENITLPSPSPIPTMSIPSSTSSTSPPSKTQNPPISTQQPIPSNLAPTRNNNSILRSNMVWIITAVVIASAAIATSIFLLRKRQNRT